MAQRYMVTTIKQEDFDNPQNGLQDNSLQEEAIEDSGEEEYVQRQYNERYNNDASQEMQAGYDDDGTEDGDGHTQYDDGGIDVPQGYGQLEYYQDYRDCPNEGGSEN